MNPPGKCYEKSLQVLITGTFDTPDAPCVLCHGYPRLTKGSGEHPAGTLYGHAWLEGQRGDVTLCIDTTTMTHCPKDLYYAVGRIDPELVRRYTKEEAWGEAKKHRHNGPWHSIPHGAAFAGSV